MRPLQSTEGKGAEGGEHRRREPPPQGFIIAVDGPAAAGKGTLARRLAAALELPYLDTGLLYRAVGMRMLDRTADPHDSRIAEQEARAMTPADLARGDLRTPRADMVASMVAAIPAVRAALISWQREFGARNGAVLDGRDIGTVIFPHAPVKLFVTASVPERARRRCQELRARGVAADLLQIEAEIRDRDAQDANRPIAPLRQAQDAVLLDTTGLSADAVFDQAMAVVRRLRPPTTP
jgi:CMP/dCMP kinase